MKTLGYRKPKANPSVEPTAVTSLRKPRVNHLPVSGQGGTMKCPFVRRQVAPGTLASRLKSLCSQYGTLPVGLTSGHLT